MGAFDHPNTSHAVLHGFDPDVARHIFDTYGHEVLGHMVDAVRQGGLSAETVLKFFRSEGPAFMEILSQLFGGLAQLKAIAKQLMEEYGPQALELLEHWIDANPSVGALKKKLILAALGMLGPVILSSLENFLSP